MICYFKKNRERIWNIYVLLLPVGVAWVSSDWIQKKIIFIQTVFNKLIIALKRSKLSQVLSKLQKCCAAQYTLTLVPECLQTGEQTRAWYSCSLASCPIPIPPIKTRWWRRWSVTGFHFSARLRNSWRLWALHFRSTQWSTGQWDCDKLLHERL